MQELLKNIVASILIFEARLMLMRKKPRIIAITGSVGKTTTKDAVYAALAPRFNVRKSQKSFNSEFGVPLTILGLENAWSNPFLWAWNFALGAYKIVFLREYPEWLVLEVGADRPGDIERISRWLKADVVVITGIPDTPAHVEYFPSPEAVAREKEHLVRSLRENGVLVVNGDDARSSAIRDRYPGRSFSYGLKKENAFAATHVGIGYEKGVPKGMYFRMNHGGASVPIKMYGALGKPRVYAALSALAVAEAAGLDAVTAAESLYDAVPTPGRMRILQGIKGSTIIDDTYNSSPAAALSALETMKQIETKGKKIAVLGDMLELGKFSKEAHREVGTKAAECVQQLITVGFRARAIAEAALDAGFPESAIRQYEQNEQIRAGKELEFELAEGDVVLVKASQSMRLEKTVEEIMGEPERAQELLVRQDGGWENR